MSVVSGLHVSQWDRRQTEQKAKPVWMLDGFYKEFIARAARPFQPSLLASQTRTSTIPSGHAVLRYRKEH